MYIGIDLGTSGVKTSLVDKEGNLIASETETYELLMPKPLWTEQKPDDWYEAVLRALKKLVKGHEGEISAISFSGQMHGLVILDENDSVIRPAILWNDQRTIAETAFINAEIGIPRLLQETGNIALTGFTAPKILWVRNHEPENFRRIRKIMLPKDYLVFRLSGVFASDVSDISGTLLFDVKKKKYSRLMLDFLGIDEDKLPKVLESWEIAGLLKEKVAKELGISRPVKVVVGGGDQAIGAVGTGSVRNGDISISLGTSGVVFVASDHYAVDEVNFLHSFAHANGRYHLMGVTLAAAGSLKWWRDSFRPQKSYDELFDELARTDVKDTLYYLPYISGERSPINNPLAKGTFSGFTTAHGLEHFSRAVVEGVVFSLRHCYEAVKKLDISSKQIRITGGGAKSDIWCQMIADVFNIAVQRPIITEGSSYGAAIMAMVGDGRFTDVFEACAKVVKVEKEFLPNSENVEIYEYKYQNYLSLYENIKPFFERLKE